MKFILELILLFYYTTNITPVFADNLKGRVGFGIGTTYYSVKYGLSKKIALELRYTSLEGITIFGVRGYYNFNPVKKTVFYSGIEIDTLNFKVDKTSGQGQSGLFFIGGEHFMTNWISINLDFGPVYTNLVSSKESSLNVQGIDWLADIGINFYW